MTKWQSGQAIRAAALTLKRQESTDVVEKPTAPLRAASVDPGPIRVRRLHLSDLRLLGRRIDVQYLDQPATRIDSGGLFTTGLGSIRPFMRQRPLTHIALTASGDFAGVVQFRQSVPDPRWTALAIGTVDGDMDPDRVAEALLEFSIQRAGSRGIRRLFARLPVDTPASAHFQRCGFEPYMRESIVQINELRAPSVVSRFVREQDQTDTWAVHQLYHAAAPRHVQFAEAWTSQRWDPSTFRSQPGQNRAWLIEGNGQVTAYVRASSGNRTAVLEAMYLPDRADAGIELVRDVARRVGDNGGTKRMYLVIRANQAELAGAMHDLGVTQIGDQDLAVRYTTAKVTGKPVEALSPSPVEVRDRVPKRVPTFMNRPDIDEAMP